MLKSFRFASVFLIVFQFACAPVRVREHQADGVKGRCGFGSSASYQKHPDLKLASFELVKVKQNLVFRAALWGEPGKSVTVSSGPAKLLFARGEGFESHVRLVSRELKINPVKEPKETVVDAGKPYVFRVDAPDLSHFLIIEAKFPYREEDAVIELPSLQFASGPFEPSVFRYRFVKKWTWTPLNGC